VLYDTPCNLFVAGFIGSPQMNFLDVTIVAKDGKLFAKLNEDMLEIPAFKCEALQPYVGKEVIMGLRPEDFLPIAQANETNAMSAQVAFYELLGAETNLYMFVGDKKVIVKAPSYVERPTEEFIRIPAEMERAHFFDKETELAIVH
jgi:multiple sugar transport system ATP-binding protein